MKAEWLLILFCGAWLGLAAERVSVSKLQKEDEILFFNTLGSMNSNRTHWLIDVNGCVFEREARAFTLSAIEKALDLRGLKVSPEELETLRQRARLFLVDYQRGRQIVIRVGNTSLTLKKTGPNGMFAGQILVPAGDLPDQDGAVVTVSAVLPREDSRTFTGSVRLFKPEGTTVLSDIDDTIKLTGVGESKAVLRSTLLLPFKPVPEMPEIFRSWKDEGAQFCYLSASPWQLYAPLTDFLRQSRFPSGVFFLKQVRFKDPSLRNLYLNPEDYKLPLIRSLLDRFPARQFILVGDASEKDPEIYGLIARERPSQVRKIVIRAPTGFAASRHAEAFKNISYDRVAILK